MTISVVESVPKSCLVSMYYTIHEDAKIEKFL